MTSALALCIAMIIDAVFGEPKWLWSRVPHPAVIIGKLISRGERRLNVGEHRFAKGAGLLALLVLFAGCLGYFFALVPWLEIILAAILLAQKSLCDHVGAVGKALKRGLREGREEVGKIVGRDTREMAPDAVARAAIESGAENFSDGVFAPALWFLIGGLPAMLIYKVVNTADSMIGHRTPRFEQFGKAAARLDDVLNYVPARLTALVMALAFGRIEPRGIAYDAAQHRSVNAGWPEAAMARVLGISLAGPRSYEGTLRPFPWINKEGRTDVNAQDISRCVTVLWRTWTICLIGLGVLVVALSRLNS